MTLFKDDLQSHYTQEKGDVSNAIRDKTCPGMAHWAGSGPPHTCRHCLQWRPRGYAVGGEIRSGECRKYSSMMPWVKQKSFVPADAHACKYFERNEDPPARVKEVGNGGS